MSEYSKLKSIELHNFMGFIKAKATFDDTGSLNLKGYNSSGKSAFLTACAVAMMNAFPQKQTKYIRHGEEYFRIILSFSDGVVIVRDKYKNGQSLYEMYKGESKVYTSKVGDKLSKVDGVPQVIENYLALINTELGYLNYQVRRDPLWLVETKGSDNYYTLNEVLKSVEIAQANALLNTDKNTLNADITVVESELNTLNNQLLGMCSVGEELLGRLYEHQNTVNELWRKYDILKDIEGLIRELNGIKVIPEIDKLDSQRLINISKLMSIIEEIEKSRFFEGQIEGIDLVRLSQINALKKVVAEINEVKYFDAEVDKIGGCDNLTELSRLNSVVTSLSEAVKELNGLNSEFKALEEERDALISEAGKQGITFTVCSNCGTMLEVRANG